MSRVLPLLPPVLLVGLLLVACQDSGDQATTRLPPPVAGQAAAFIEGGGETDQDYELVPGSDGRVFLVLDCVTADGSSVLTARRADGQGWGPPSPEPELAVPCDADGQRLAILARGTPGTPIPLVVQTAGDQWRIAQTYDRPNG